MKKGRICAICGHSAHGAEVCRVTHGTFACGCVRSAGSKKGKKKGKGREAIGRK